MTYDVSPRLGDLSLTALQTSGSMKWTTFPDRINGHRTIPCFVAEMDFEPAPNIREALVTWAKNAPLGYRPPSLVHDFQNVIARYYNDAGLAVEHEAVRPISDVMSAYDAVARIFTAPGSPITLLTPAYMNFVRHIFRDQRPIRNVSMLAPDGLHEHWRIDWQALEQALSDGGLLVLVNPHNPIGKVYTAAELEQIASLAQRYRVRVFADEIHSPLVFDGNRHIPFASVSKEAAECGITAWSATKAFSIPGTKAAALVFTNQQDHQRWNTFGQHYEMGTASSGYVATIAALNEAGDWHSAVLQQLERNRALIGDLVAQYIPEAIYTPPQATYLAWLDFRGTPNYKAVAAEVTNECSLAQAVARQCGVIATDGAETGRDGIGHLRINFATGPKVLKTIFARLGSVFSGS